MGARLPWWTVRWAPAAGGAAPVFWALVSLGLALRVGTILNREIDPDESQHLHAAWLVGQGRLPYLDFWEHHTPLLYLALAPLTRWLADSPAIHVAGRAVMALLALGSLLLLYRLALRLGQPTARLAVVLFLLLPRIVENTTEVRPDGPALLAWLATLLALVRWRETGRARWVWLAGLALGAGGTLTPKAAYGGLGAGVAVAAAALIEGGPRRAAAAIVPLVAGSLAPLGLLAGWLGLAGGAAALVAMVDGVVWQNVAFMDDTKAPPVYAEGVAFVLLALLGAVVIARRHGRGLVGHPLHGPLLVPALVLTTILRWPGIPAVYVHAWLPVLTVATVYAAAAIHLATARARAGVGLARLLPPTLAIVLGIAVPAAETVHDALRDQTTAQLRVVRALLRHACPGEPVLDGTALAVFRPAAYRFQVLVYGVRLWLVNGIADEGALIEEIRRAAPPVAYLDKRLADFVNLPLGAFLRRHYLPRDDGLLVPGAIVAVPGGPQGGRAYVELLTAGPYFVSVTPGIDVRIDRTPTGPGVVALAAGRHEVTWVGPPGTIRLIAATCPERPKRGEIQFPPVSHPGQ